ncbi:MAG: hypothetical protein ACRDD1_17775, partial [Planctomycetia bacterium]
GLLKFRGRRLIDPVFGPTENVIANVTAINPADLIFTTDLQPGELQIYLHYPGFDNFNFDAQNESFAWLAARKGIHVELERDPTARHLNPYFRPNERSVFDWMGPRLPPPAPVEPLVEPPVEPAATSKE